MSFKETYINYNFDDILINANNSLVNSFEHYLRFKQIYMSKSLHNYARHNKLSKQIEELENLHVSNTSNSYNYTYINVEKLDILKNEIKTIILEQTKLYNDFLHYIKFLNENVSKLMSTNTNSSRTILPRMRRFLKIKSYS